jgi:hypothetical protein
MYPPHALPHTPPYPSIPPTIPPITYATFSISHLKLVKYSQDFCVPFA